MAEEKQCPGVALLACSTAAVGAGLGVLQCPTGISVNSVFSANDGTSLWYLSELPAVTVLFWEAAALCVCVHSSVPYFPALLSHVIRGIHFVR